MAAMSHKFGDKQFDIGVRHLMLSGPKYLGPLNRLSPLPCLSLNKNNDEMKYVAILAQRRVPKYFGRRCLMEPAIECERN